MRSSSDSNSQPAVARDHDLAVQHEAGIGAAHGPERLDQLREVSVQRLQVPRLQVELLAVAEDEGPEAIPLRLVAPAVADGQLGSGLGQHRLDGRRNREGHRRPMIRGAIGHTPARHGDQPSVPGCRGHRHRLAVPGPHRERHRAGGLRHVPGLAGGGEPQPDPVRLRGRASWTRCCSPTRTSTTAVASRPSCGRAITGRSSPPPPRPTWPRSSCATPPSCRARPKPDGAASIRTRRPPTTPTCSRRRPRRSSRPRTTRRCRSGSARRRRRA